MAALYNDAPSPTDLSRARFAWLLLALVMGAACLRTAFPTADPPWRAPVGITWHDEGPWVHNARNRVLWGEWSTDRWNPVYLAPVFTALEYASFESLGVGLWQARTVSIVMGTLAILCVATGVAAFANRRAALAAAALLAANHSWVQWNRVALLEPTMVAFIAISWSAYAMAGRRAWWGSIAGVAAVFAFFSKAAAAFYVIALAVEIAVALALSIDGRQNGTGSDQRRQRARAAALWTLGGLALAGGVFLVGFVLPYWPEFRFYNWQMSVTRKPAYGLTAFVSRASWVPVVNDFFTRMLPVTLLGLTASLGLMVRWRTAAPAERLLSLWIALGVTELIMHDAGNERRLIILIPPLIVLAALALVGGSPVLPPALARVPRRRALLAAPILLYAAYMVCGALVRVAFVPQVRPSVWGGAAAAVAVTALIYVTWPRAAAWLSTYRFAPRTAAAIMTILVAADLVQYWQWAAHRTYKNVTASQLIGQWLPPGTLVHGKLANGLSLDNRIRPVFVGHLFGNYDDRTNRTDVHYILTYTSPRLGYEGPVILDVLAAHPGWKIVHEFDVAETPGGRDRAALIEKP